MWAPDSPGRAGGGFTPHSPQTGFTQPNPLIQQAVADDRTSPCFTPPSDGARVHPAERAVAAV